MKSDLDKWSEDHIGSMAFWRTVIGMINLVLAGAVTLKVFGLI